MDQEKGRQTTTNKNSKGNRWMTAVLTIILTLPGGMVIGYHLYKVIETDGQSEIQKVENSCANTPEAKALRNEAWAEMNQPDEQPPSSPTGYSGKVLQHMLKADTSEMDRMMVLDRFMQKSVIPFLTDDDYTAWMQGYTMGDNPTRLEKVKELLAQDQRVSELMQCLIQDTVRMQKVADGKPVPLEK